MEKIAVLGGREYSAEELLDLLYQYVSEMERLWEKMSNSADDADSGKQLRRKTRFFELRASAGLAVDLLRKQAQTSTMAGIFFGSAVKSIPPGLAGRLSLAMSREVKARISISRPPEVSLGLTSRQRRILAGLWLIDLPQGRWTYSVYRTTDSVGLRVESKNGGGCHWELNFRIFGLKSAENHQFDPKQLKTDVCQGIKNCLEPQRDKLARALAEIEAELNVLCA